MTLAAETALPLPYAVRTLAPSLHGPAGTVVCRCESLNVAGLVVSAARVWGLPCEIDYDAPRLCPCVETGADPRACSCATCPTPERCEPSASASALPECAMDEATGDGRR